MLCTRKHVYGKVSSLTPSLLNGSTACQATREAWPPLAALDIVSNSVILPVPQKATLLYAGMGDHGGC